MFLTRTVSFPCNATGSPQAKIAWYHNGKQVSAPTSGSRIVISSTNELTVSSLQTSDGGFYQCLATNDGGQSIATAFLKLKSKNSIFVYLRLSPGPPPSRSIYSDTIRSEGFEMDKPFS